MYHTLKKQLFLFLMGGALLAANACGDDDDNHDHADAAPKADAGPQFDAKPEADAAPKPFGTTVAVTEIAVSNPELAPGVPNPALRGAKVTLSVTDPDDVTVDAEPGFESAVAGCRIVIYDVAGGEAPPKGSDGGTVTITGTNSGEFACNFNAERDDYLCSSTDSAWAGAVAVEGSSLTSNENGTAVLVIAGADFSNANYKGMHIALSDFDDATANGNHAILAQPAANTLVIANAAFGGKPAGTASVPSKATTYATFVGAGPIPGSYDFLGAGGTEEKDKVKITKPEMGRAAAIDVALSPNGQLENDTGTGPIWMPRAHEFPLTAAEDFTFACGDGKDGDRHECGAAQGVLKGVSIFGETTDGSLEGLLATDMPDPVNSYATFQCSAPQGEAVTLTKDALALILGTSPTRVQTSLVYINAVSDTANGITALVGHGEVGFTDIPATESAKK